MEFKNTEFYKYYTGNIEDKLVDGAYYPAKDNIFKAFKEEPKVIVLGQD